MEHINQTSEKREHINALRIRFQLSGIWHKGGTQKIKLNSFNIDKKKKKHTQINNRKTIVAIIPNFKYIKLAKAGIIIRNSYSVKKI